MPEEDSLQKTNSQKIDRFTFLLKAIWFIGPAVLGAFVAYGTAVKTDIARENRITTNETDIRSIRATLAEMKLERERDRERYLTSEEFDRSIRQLQRSLDNIQRTQDRGK